MDTILQKKLSIDKTKWTPVKFGEVVFEPKESSKDPVADGIKHVVGLEHIESENIHLRKSETLEESTTFTKKFAIGDVLFGRRRAYLRKASQASFNGICSGDITVFRAKENLMPELLPFVVNNEKFFDYAIKHSAGGLSPRVKFKDLANYEFLLPPKDQQAQLAKLLWAMDEVIEKEKELFNKLKTNYLVIRKKKLNNKKFFEDRIEDLAKTSAGGTPSTKREDFWNGDVPWINSGKLKNKLISSPSKMITKLGIEKSSAKLWDKNTTLIALTGATTGEIGYLDFECSGNQSIVAIKSNGKILDKYFFYYLIEFKHRILQQAIGSAQPHINKDIVDKFKMRYPEIDEQSVLIKEFDRFVDLMQINLEKINFSQSLQKSLINQIF